MWSGAIWWILFVAFAVYVGSILGSGRGFSKLIPYFSRDKTNKLKFPWIRKIIFICTLLGLGAVIITLHSRGYNIFSLFSLDSIQQMGQDFSFARYHEGYSPPLLATFFSTFIYFGAILGGILFTISLSKKDYFLSFFPFLPAFLMAVIHTTRTSILFPVVLWITSYFSMQVLLNKGVFRFFTWKRVLLIFFLVIFIISMVMILQMFRSDRFGWSYTYQVWRHIRGGLFGGVSAFSYWLEINWAESISPSFGSFSLAGLYDWFGISERKAGLYEIHVPISYEKSINVFTWLRGLIDDFTLTGSLLFLFLMGIFGGFSFYQVAKGKIIYLPFLLMFYGLTLWSYIVSLFNYNSILLAWFLFMFYIIVIVSKENIEKRMFQKT